MARPGSPRKADCPETVESRRTTGANPHRAGSSGNGQTPRCTGTERTNIFRLALPDQSCHSNGVDAEGFIMAKRATGGKISDILIRNKVITAEALKQAETDASAGGLRLEKFLIEKKIVKGDDLVLALAEYLRMTPITLAHFVPAPHLLELVPKEIITKRNLMPIAKIGKTLTVALGDPFDLMALDELTTITGLTITPLVASETELREIIARIFADSGQNLNLDELMRDDSEVEVVEEEKTEQSIDEMLESADTAPVIKMVNMMLMEAMRTNASDIHIEPMEKTVRLRYRIDGELVERPGPPKGLQNAVISRVKILSDLNIAERRIPQDGRFNIKAMGKEIDLRVSILPTVHGEKIVMRTLDRSKLFPNVAAMGLDKKSEESLSFACSQPQGMILVTGPTGSGKTFTLYSCLQEMNQINVNVITCEDPVEFQLPGINQVQINADVGLSFASALRSILRQDPDIVLVGEIRDGETADIAVKAAITGHLVLSTLHTNDAAGAVARLVDMGIEPFMLGSCLILAQAQRLYRKLCPACKKVAAVSPDILAANHIEPNFFEGSKIFKNVGCPRCTNGYKGRGSLMEILLVNDEVRDGILKGSTSTDIRELGRKNGMLTLKEAGLTRVKEGMTSLEQALEVTGGGD